MQTSSKHTLNRLKTIALYTVGAAGLAALALFFMHDKAKAADKGGPANLLNDIAPAPGAWSGCGPALRAGWMIGALDASPVTLGSEGGVAGVGFGCDWQAGRHFLIGAFV